MWTIGDTYRQTFATVSVGVQVDADSLPTGVLRVDGSASAVTVTVVKIGTGLYQASCSLATLSDGDACEVVITATMATVTFSQGLGGFPVSAAGATPEEIAEAVEEELTATGGMLATIRNLVQSIRLK